MRRGCEEGSIGGPCTSRDSKQRRKVAVATETLIPAILGTCGGKGGTQGPPSDCSHSVRAVEKRGDESAALGGGVLAQAAAR